MTRVSYKKVIDAIIDLAKKAAKEPWEIDEKEDADQVSEKEASVNPHSLKKNLAKELVCYNRFWQLIIQIFLKKKLYCNNIKLNL